MVLLAGLGGEVESAATLACAPCLADFFPLTPPRPFVCDLFVDLTGVPETGFPLAFDCAEFFFICQISVTGDSLKLPGARHYDPSMGALKSVINGK